MPYVNVRDFGARGDGVTDDTRAITTAMEAASGSDGTVYFPKGIYCVHPISVPSGITLMGNASWGYSAFGYGNNKIEEGDPVDPDYNGQTVLFSLSQDAEALLTLEDCCGNRVIGLSLDGEYKGDHFNGIYVKGGHAIFLEDIRCCHFTGNGVRISADTYAIRRSLLIKSTGASVDGSAGSHGRIIDCQLAYNDGPGFFADGTEDVSFTGNRIEGGCAGVKIANGSQIAITGNSFDSPRGPAIHLDSCSVCALTGNMARISGARREVSDDNTHCRLENSRGVAMIGNTFWGWFRLAKRHSTHFGMVISHLEDSVITGNAFYESCSDDLCRDLGGHQNLIMENNTGSVFDLSTFPPEEE